MVAPISPSDATRDHIRKKFSPMKLRDFFHRAFNPHCKHCELQKDQELMIEQRIHACKACDILINQLEHERAEKNRLLEVILDSRTQPVNEAVPPSQEFKPINPSPRGWGQQRAILEYKSRMALEELQKAKLQSPELKQEIDEQISELEKETGVADNA